MERFEDTGQTPGASMGVMCTDPITSRQKTAAVEAEPVDGVRFRLGMRRLVSGVCLIATEHRGKRWGLVATSVSSLASEPPTLLACVNRSASGHAPLSEAGTMCVNLLATSHREIADQFSDTRRRAERFQTGRWTTMTTGAPVLEDAIASFDCRIERVIDHATHSIFIGLVLAARVADARSKPMIYFDCGYTELAD